MLGMKSALRLFLSIVLTLPALVVLGQSGWARYSIEVQNAGDVQRIADSPLELFSEQIAMPLTDVVVGPGEMPVLQGLGLSYRYVSTLPDPRAWGVYWPAGNDYRNSYLRYDAMLAQYELWRAMYPQLMTRTAIGTSIQGRTLYAYRISTDGGGARSRQNFVILGGTHAREWIAPSVVMHATEKLLNGALTDPLVSSVLRRAAVHVVPVINPDGYEYSWTNNRMWRKNRRNNGNGTFGVDLNRNYTIGWGGEGSSNNPSSDVYHGTAPFSEPELQHLRTYVSRLRGLVGFIDWHSYAEKILYPWSYTTAPNPAGVWHKQVADAMKADMITSGGHSYVTGQGSIALYVAGGASKDWFYNDFNATSYTIELRDTGEFGFLLPESQIIPTQDEAWAGFKKFLVMVSQNN